MRSSTAAFQTLLNSQQYNRCHLFTLTTFAGNVYTWTDADVDVVANGVTYSSSGPSISGVKYRQVRGLQVDSMDLTVLTKATDLVNGVSWDQTALSGAFDGSTIKIDFALLASWGASAESINLFLGTIQDVYRKELGFGITVVSDADDLNQLVPKLVFQPGCTKTLYAPDCGVARAGFTVAGSVLAATDRVSFTTNLTQADGFFSLGAITFSSGANSGVKRSVKAHIAAGGKVTLSYPLAANLAVGDAFVITAGCDRTRGSNGCAKFNNVINFKGFPYLPMPDALA